MLSNVVGLMQLSEMLSFSGTKWRSEISELYQILLMQSMHYISWKASVFINLRTVFESLQKYILPTWKFASLTSFFFIRTAISAACSPNFGIAKRFYLIWANIDFPKTNEVLLKQMKLLHCDLTFNVNIIQRHMLG